MRKSGIFMAIDVEMVRGSIEYIWFSDELILWGIVKQFSAHLVIRPWVWQLNKYRLLVPLFIWSETYLTAWPITPASIDYLISEKWQRSQWTHFSYSCTRNTTGYALEAICLYVVKHTLLHGQSHQLRLTIQSARNENVNLEPFEFLTLCRYIYVPPNIKLIG